MTDARRTDLNYGHFGEPVYDAENHEWHFARNSQDVPQFQALGESQVLLPAQLAKVDENIRQNAAQRGQNVNQLVRTYPEIAPGSSLLSSLAKTSEIVQETTAGYDPTISELLAFGQALHPHHHRNDPKTVPVVAVPGGLAGQLVRVVQLVPEIVGWDGQGNIKLKNEGFQSRVQGLWSGNGSRIQQLHFVKSDIERTEWLAVRYGGATSILRPVLREKEVPQLHHLCHLPVVEDVEFRIELEQIVTLTTRRSGGIPHADICFNPWSPSEFAIVDQSSRWSVWKIQSINATTGVWKLASGLSGRLEESLSDGAQQPVDTVIVVLLSRLTGLKTIFTLENGHSSSKVLSSVCDPYGFPVASPEHSASSKSLSFALRALPYESHCDRSEHGPHVASPKDDNLYLKYVTLNSDLSLREGFLVAASSTLFHPLQAPQRLSRQGARKSSYRVQEDFIILDGTPDVITQNNRRIQPPNPSIKHLVNTSVGEDQGVPALEDQRTINLEWLTDHINSSPSIQFDEALHLIPGRIADRMEAIVPGIVSMEELLDYDAIVGDIENDSVALEDLLSIIEYGSAAGHEDLAGLPGQSISTSRLHAGSLQLGDSLSRTYDALIMSWVSSLAARIPGRVRMRTERLIRSIAAELQLANCGLRLRLKENQREDGSQSVANEGRATFNLAVRSVPDFSYESRQVKEKAIQPTSGEAETSPNSEDPIHMPPASLPTPEPTPSVNSQVSYSTPDGTEDSATKRLRSFASVASQPPLPPAMMGILSHWPVGHNPDDYDWETSKAALKHDDKPEEAEEGARLKKRQRRNRPLREQPENAVVTLSQLPTPRLTASQVERPSDQQYSSQPTPATGSQPQPGRFGSRKLVKKDRKDKKPGFR
ncbi:MAG: hypothetical protein Q9196_001570 [Gyalolechia fulgens]